MKKLFALLLTLAMVLTLAACGEATDVRGTQIDNKPETPDKNESVFTMGKVSGLVYENSFIGIGCKLDSSWRFFTDEEIREMNNITAEMAGEEMQAIVENASLVYDMQAVSSSGMDNIIVNLEKATAMQLATLDMTQMFQSQMPVLKSSFENMGYTNVEFEISQVNIGGKEFPALLTHGDIGDYRLCQASIAIKCDGYLASVSITTFDEQTLKKLIGSFYLI